MKNKFSISIIFFCSIFLFAKNSDAHQPQIVLGESRIMVDGPEISKAYYAELDGQSDFFMIHSDSQFDLYVNVLVPDVRDVRSDVSFEIKRDGETISMMNGKSFDWANFYEPFAGDNYLKGPEYRLQAESGDYEIKVFNSDNSGKYALVIGEKESFSKGEMFRTIKLISRIKKDFFGESTLSAYLNQINLLLLAMTVSIVGIISLTVLAFRRKRRAGLS